MKVKIRVLKLHRIIVTVLGAATSLVLLLALLAGARSQAAPLDGPAIGDDPEIRRITMTADLPHYDPLAGDGAVAARTVYFSNAIAGAITMTFDISGTPALTLTAGAAFDEPERVYTSAVTRTAFTVTYSVVTTHATQPSVICTAVNTNGAQTTVAITYVRDITAPTFSIVNPPADYFTSTQLVVTGTAQDNAGGSGVQRVLMTTGTLWIADTAVPWRITTTLPITEGWVYTVAARAEDHLGTLGVVDTRVITVDNVRPANPDLVTTTNGTVAGRWLTTSTVPVTWSLVTDGSGVSYYYTWTTTGTAVVGAAAPFTMHPPLTGADLFQGDNWFHLRARDGAGNWAANTTHRGPFKVDTVSPTVVISTPTPGAVVTTALSSIPISGVAADGTSGITQVLVTTGTAWVAADGIAPWTYTWTLPITDNVVYTISAMTTDAASNAAASDDVTVTVDTVAPTATVPLDAGEWSITSTLVFTWLPADDAAGIAGYYVVITGSDGITVASDVFVTTTVYTITAGEGVTEGVAYYARVKARDTNGNIGDYGATSDGITPDLTGPIINYGTPPIYAVGDWLSATGSTVFYTNTMLFDQDFRIQGSAAYGLSGPGTITATPALNTPNPSNGGSWFSWYFDYAVSNGMTESNHISVTVRNLIGNPAALVFTYTFDGNPPYTGSLVINGGAAYATQTNVTLALYADDVGCGVDEMSLRDDSSGWSGWEGYAVTRDWPLTAGDGERTIYIRFRDHLGNVSAIYTDTIFLDATVPDDPIFLLADRSTGDTLYTNEWVVTATVGGEAGDVTAWLIAEGQFDQPAEDDLRWGVEPITFTLSLSDGLKTVYVWIKDYAGNFNPGPVSGTITLDTSAPGAPTLSLADRSTGDTLYTNERVVTATVGGEAADVAAWLIAEGQSGQPAEDDLRWGVEPITFTLSLSDGLKTAYVWVKDHAGNVNSTPVSGTITLDTSAPGDPVLSLADMSTGDTLYTNERVVTATVGGEAGDVAAWLIAEGQSGQPAEDDLRWGEESITFTLSLSDGLKTVCVWIKDRAGNTNSGPISDTIFLDTQAPAVTVVVPQQVGITAVPLQWGYSDPAPSSGIAAYDVFVRADGGAWQPWLSEQTITATVFPSATLGHTYTFSVTARDQAGNTGAGQGTVLVELFRVYLPLLVRNYPPLPEGSVEIKGGAACVYRSSVTLSLTATVTGDTVDQMCISNSPTCDDWIAFAEQIDWTLASGISGPRTVYARFKGSHGGVSEQVSAQIYLAWNGDFENDWDHWEHDKDSFAGYGSGLDQSIVFVDGSNRLLLGDPTYQDNTIPVGYAYIAQEFTVPAGNPSLSLQYRIHSRDTVWGETTQRYFDTFELSINRPPGQISDGERDNRGCRDTSRLNPTGLLTPSGDGLVFCGGRSPTSSHEWWDSGWRTVTLDLSAFAGQNITLYVATWGREYVWPYVDDKGYFNTYSYIDDITVYSN